MGDQKAAKPCPDPALLAALLIAVKNGLPIVWDERKQALLEWAKDRA